jgi:hypothetical protein
MSMSTDRYTKTVLTVIAAALVAIVAQNAIKTSQAQGDQVQKVAICNLRETPAACANVANVFGTTFGLVTVSRQ